jgi:hypothetical protein
MAVPELKDENNINFMRTTNFNCSELYKPTHPKPTFAHCANFMATC